MQTVRYTGTAGVREISSNDFKSVGVEDQNLIRVRGANLMDEQLRREIDDTVEVSEAAAKYLIENEDFELVEKTPSSSQTAKSEKSKG